MLTLFIVLSSIFGYFLLAGATWHLVSLRAREAGWYIGGLADIGVFFCVLFWPAAFPTFLGRNLANRVGSKPGIPRRVQRKMLIQEKQNAIAAEAVRIRREENKELERAIRLAASK